MAVKALGYIGIGASDIESWRAYAANILGAQVDDSAGGGLSIRIDSRAWRISLEPSDKDDILFAGWELDGPQSLSMLTAALNAAGYVATRDDALAVRRGVKGLVRVVDPAGVSCELFWGATERFETPLVTRTGGGAFVTGEQGLGHIVLSTVDPDAMLAFYGGLLGFGLSDFIDDPRLGSDKMVSVTFLHCNPRHHSLAFAAVPAPKTLLHFMLQRELLDDVGYALDRVKMEGVKLSLSLGRHVNDHMISFYAFTPSGFEVEYGWGARTVEPARWSPVRHDRISVWGHTTINASGTGWREQGAA